MTGKGLYDEKKSSAKPAANNFAAAAARATRAPRLQGAAPQKEKREKSPSELGEEVLALVLEEDMAKSRQTAGGAAAKNAAAANTVTKQQAAPYGGGFTTKNTGVRKETAPYGGAFAAANAAAKQQAAPYGGGFTVKNTGARKETTPYGGGFTVKNTGARKETTLYGGGFTVKNTGIRKETAPYGGGAGRTAAQYEPPLYPPPAAGESVAPQALAAAGLDENAIRGARWRDDFSNATQTIDKMTAPIRATPEWQAQAAAQDLSYAGLDANAQLGLGYGDGLFRLDQKLDEMTAPIRATPEWQAVAESQQLSGLGLDTAAQLGYNMGQPIGAWASQLVDDTHLAPGTSVWDFFVDKFKSGVWSGTEGARNGLIDLGEGAARNDLMMQDFERQQYAFLGEPYAELNRMWTEQVLEGLPQAAEGMRSHKAAEYAQYIDELYGAGGLLKLGGDTSFAMGNMAPALAFNALTGGMGGMPYLFTSAEGNASAEARANGADESMALLYGLASGGKEFWTEKLSGGIPGLGKGKLDDLVMGLAQTERGRDVLKLAWDFLGEGAEEFLGEMADAYLAKMWNGDERGVWQTFQETLPDALYSGLVGALSSAGLNAPGYAADALQRGGTAARARVEREAADRRQFEEYKVVLGENAPKTFAEFQNLKYNDPERWDNTKRFVGYKRRVPEATETDFRKYQQVEATGIVGTTRVPSEKIDASKLIFRDEHAARHGCTVEEARGYVENAVCSIRRKRWDKIESINYYSKDGATYIDAETKEIKASFPKSNFDPTTKSVVEVFE